MFTFYLLVIIIIIGNGDGLLLVITGGIIMLVNSVIKHNKYGSGKVVDYSANSSDALKSTITVEFEDGITKKFGVSLIDKMFEDIPEDFIDYINGVREESEAKRKAYLDTFDDRKPIKKADVCYFDRDQKEVTEEDWKRAYEVAGKYRFYHESRAVVMDNSMIFINAAAALRYIESRPEDGDKLYQVCEKGKGRFLSHRWRYASKEDIMENCLNRKEAE